MVQGCPLLTTARHMGLVCQQHMDGVSLQQQLEETQEDAHSMRNVIHPDVDMCVQKFRLHLKTILFVLEYYKCCIAP